MHCSTTATMTISVTPVNICATYSTTPMSLRPLLSTMAKLIRTVKSGSDWTANELTAYNITIVSQNKEEFFGTTNFPDPAELTVAGVIRPENRADFSARGQKTIKEPDRLR